MSALRELLGRFGSFFRKRAREEDFDDELRALLEIAVEDNLARGMSHTEARRQALVSLGGVEQAKQAHRESRGLPVLDAVLQDVRYAGRTLRRDAGLTAFAVLIVGLGVGASSTVFSVCNALLIRSLPFAHPDRLVWIANGASKNLSNQTVQVANLEELQTQSKSFEDIAAYSPFYGSGDLRLTGAGEAERLTGVPVTEGFFRLLGVQPMVGRSFTAEECRWNAPKTAVLSNGFWRRRFGSDPGVLGRPITLNGAPVTVVGVLPASFDFAATFAPGSRADLFVPYPLTPETDRQGNTLALIGRLKSGVTLAQAQAEAPLIESRVQKARNEGVRRNSFRPSLDTLQAHVSGQFRFALTVLAAAVGFLMTLVCANLSNLLLARASSRQKEMAIRTALGAGRWRLIRQMLIESVALACGGAALGVAIAYGGTSLLRSLDGSTIPLLHGARVDGVVLGFTLAVTVLTGIVFGVLPSVRASAPAPHGVLKESGRGSIGGKDRGWVRGSLVVCEIALACVLLTGAGLLTRSLVRLLSVDLGFEAENLLALRIDPGQGASNHARKLAYFDHVLRSVRSAPGVEAAGLTDALPLGDNFGWRLWDVQAKGQVYERGRVPHALIRIVDEQYVNTMRVVLRSGRGFEATDNATAEGVVLINEPLARRLWPDGSAVGRVVQTSRKDWRVVGVVGEARYFGLERESGPELYLPIRQTGDFASVDLVVRGPQTASALIPSVRAAIRAVDPGIPAVEFRTMRELVDRSTLPRRFIVFLLAGFAGFGLLLASLGIYGVISYSVGQRKQEIGIRIALGASPGALKRGIVMQTLQLAGMGLLIGVPASWIAARSIQGLLFGVQSADPATFACVLVLLGSVTAVAGYLPARRAAALNPVEALRSE